MGMKFLTSFVLTIFFVYGANSAVFTVKNNCPYEIWPATLTHPGAQILTGFSLAPQASRDISVSAPWSGRLWARFQCSNSAGRFTCRSGDCGSGQTECNGASAIPPASLVELTLNGDNGQDTYDVSLVDGFNLPVSLSPVGVNCPSTSCPADINRNCPNELAVRDPNGGVLGCKSACVAFGQPQYCCTGAFDKPETCKPTNYSQMFKSQCPQAYSYAYDDPSSIFRCPTGANYLITFCP